MKNMRAALLVGIILAANRTMSQPITLKEQLKEEPYIEVTGRSEVKVVPDRIVLMIALQERGSGSNKVTVEQQELDLKRAVETLGIPMAKLTLRDALADLVTRTFRKDEVIARKSYELELTDAETVRKVFKEPDLLEIEDAHIDRVSHSKEVEFRKEQRIQAIRLAKAKAEYLLTAIDERCGAPLIIREEYAVPQGIRYNQALISNNNYEAYDDRDGSMDVAFSSVVIAAEVYVKFAIAKR